MSSIYNQPSIYNDVAGKTKKKGNHYIMDQVQPNLLTEKSRIFLMRNGEPCDRLIPVWSHKAFRDIDTYRLVDLNQPYTTVNRATSSSGAEEAADLFKNDAPLTQIGKISAKRIGRAFYKHNIQFHTVICSPALRCVQTAEAVLSEMELKEPVKLCVEPGLLDPVVFYLKEKSSLPKFMDSACFEQNGFEIDTSYAPVCTMEKIRGRTERTPLEFYSRIVPVASLIRNKAKSNDSGVLVVAHAPTIDAIARNILDRKDLPQSRFDLYRMGLFYPFCSVTTLEPVEAADAAASSADEGEEGKATKWTIKRRVIPPITYGHINTTSHVPSFA